MGQYSMFIIIALFAVAVYFMMIRPQKKQQQKQQEMMNALQPGERVMLTSGIYGTIRHLGESQVVIEISPGVDLTVLRRAVAKVAVADEDEFEYADAADAPQDPPRDGDDEAGWTADPPPADSATSPTTPASPTTAPESDPDAPSA